MFFFQDCKAYVISVMDSSEVTVNVYSLLGFCDDDNNYIAGELLHFSLSYRLVDGFASVEFAFRDNAESSLSILVTIFTSYVVLIVVCRFNCFLGGNNECLLLYIFIVSLLTTRTIIRHIPLECSLCSCSIRLGERPHPYIKTVGGASDVKFIRMVCTS